MAILTTSGRAALAAAVKDQPLYLALGEGEPHWDVEREQTETVGGDGTIDLGYTNVSDFTLMNSAQTLTYTLDTDYSLDAGAGVITSLTIPAGTEVFARFTPEHPSEPTDHAALMSEVGRRLVEETHFVIPDDGGEISVPTGRYIISTEESRHLFVRVRFDFEDASTVTVREQGLFVAGATDPALPSGQRYFTPAQVTDPGTLLLLQYSVPIVRQPSTRETFEFVITF